MVPNGQPAAPHVASVYSGSGCPFDWKSWTLKIIGPEPLAPVGMPVTAVAVTLTSHELNPRSDAKLLLCGAVMSTFTVPPTGWYLVTSMVIVALGAEKPFWAAKAVALAIAASASQAVVQLSRYTFAPASA